MAPQAVERDAVTRLSDRFEQSGAVAAEPQQY